MTFFFFAFIKAPTQFLPETEGFASIQVSSLFLALCDLPEIYVKKFFMILKFFFLDFSFSSFREKVVFEFYAYHLECFWHCKIDEILTKVSFCIFKIPYFLNLERGVDLGRSRLVFNNNFHNMDFFKSE